MSQFIGRSRHFFMLLLFSIIVWSLSKSETLAQGLAPHRAVYDVSLTKMTETEGVRGARGTMVFVITDRCDGYTLEATLNIDMAFASGVVNAIDQRYASWEAKNGRTSTFRLEVIENGRLSRSQRGRIELKGDRSGDAVLESEGITSFELPPGTLLSTSHLQSVLDGAQAGRRFLSAPVMDGALENGPYRVTAVIGEPQSERARALKNELHEIGRGPHWPVSMAYFLLDSNEGLPEFEVEVELMSGGITRAMTQDFGDFGLGFELVYVEPLEVTCEN